MAFVSISKLPIKPTALDTDYMIVDDTKTTYRMAVSDIITAQKLLKSTDLSKLLTSAVVMMQDGTTLQQKIENLLASIDTLISEMSTAQTDISTNTDNISSVLDKITALETSITDLSSSIDSNNTTLTNEVSSLSSTVDTLKTSVTTLQSSVETNTGDISTLTQGLADLKTYAEATDSVSQANKENISNLASTVDSHTTGISNLNTLATELEAENKTISSTLDTLSTTVDGYSDKISALSSEVDANNTKVDSLSSEVDTLSTTVSTLSTTVAEHTTEIAALQALASHYIPVVQYADLTTTNTTMVVNIEAINFQVTLTKTSSSNVNMAVSCITGTNTVDIKKLAFYDNGLDNAAFDTYALTTTPKVIDGTIYLATRDNPQLEIWQGNTGYIMRILISGSTAQRTRAYYYPITGE